MQDMYGMPGVTGSMPSGMMYPGMMQPGITPAGMMFPEDMGETDYPLSPATQDPPPVLSNNPATATIVLFKELTAYPNYGNPSGNADILYTGNRGVWTFDLPAPFFAQANYRVRLIIRAVLDDHYDVPVSRYSARITVNGIVVHNGPVPLEHGTPAGGRFTNWRDLAFNITEVRRSNRIVMVNTSTAGQNDWIGLDWMEMRLSQV